MTVDGKVQGTAAYVSPEQARGEGHTVDRRIELPVGRLVRGWRWTYRNPAISGLSGGVMLAMGRTTRGRVPSSSTGEIASRSGLQWIVLGDGSVCDDVIAVLTVQTVPSFRDLC